MVTSSPSSSATQLLALRPEIAQALDPVPLADLKLPLTPGLAALSFLSSRQAFWEAHVVIVSFAMDIVGGADAPRVMAELSGRDGISEWFENSALLSYSEDQGLATTRSGLIFAARIIDDAVQGDALQGAQFGTVKINYCKQRCGDNWSCMVECLNS